MKLYYSFTHLDKYSKRFVKCDMYVCNGILLHFKEYHIYESNTKMWCIGLDSVQPLTVLKR